MGFLKSLFSTGKQNNTEDNNQKNTQKNFEIFKYDGMRAQRIGQIDYAIKCFKEALNLQKDFETMNYLSQTYIQKGELEPARELLQQMLETDPEHIDTYLVLANVCFVQEDYQAMVENARKAIELNKENATAYYLEGKAEHKLDNDLMSIAGLTKAIALKSNYTEALLLRAEILLKLKQYQEASEDIKAILQENAEDENALLLQGELEEATGKEDEAEKNYLSVTELNPFNEQAYLHLGQLYIGQKKLAEAIELFNEAIDLNPNFAQAYHERGRAKLLNGDKEGSVEDMKKSLELNPKENENLTGKFENMGSKPETIPGIF